MLPGNVEISLVEKPENTRGGSHNLFDNAPIWTKERGNEGVETAIQKFQTANRQPKNKRSNPRLHLNPLV